MPKRANPVVRDDLQLSDENDPFFGFEMAQDVTMRYLSFAPAWYSKPRNGERLFRASIC